MLESALCNFRTADSEPLNNEPQYAGNCESIVFSVDRGFCFGVVVCVCCVRFASGYVRRRRNDEATFEVVVAVVAHLWLIEIMFLRFYA